MNTKKALKWLLSGAALVVLASCHKDPDEPPHTPAQDGVGISVTELRDMYTGTPIHFVDGDTNLRCVVTADEVSGNLYKNIYVTDGNRGLNIRLVSSGGLYEGDSIRINLNGTILSKYNNMLQLDSVDVNKNVVKLKSGLTVVPKDATLDEVLTDPNLQGMLVKMSNVEFLNTEVGSTYADAVNLATKNKTLLSCATQNTLIVRTSGYANFAGSVIPGGNGSVVGVVSQFNSDIQLYLRRTADVNTPNASCQPTIYFSDNFDIPVYGGTGSDLTVNGWISKIVTGSVGWTRGSHGAMTDYYALLQGNGAAIESWMISPAFDLSASTSPVLSFRTAAGFSGGPEFTAWVSSNYDGTSDPNTATWTQLSPALSAGSYAWTSSGALDLSSFMTTNVRFAFKFTTASSTIKWEVDNIELKDL